MPNLDNKEKEENFQNIALDSKEVSSPTTSPSSEALLPSIPKKKCVATLSFVSMIYHRVIGKAPDGRDIRWGRPLTKDDPPFIIPKIKLTTEWKQIDPTWIEPKECSILIISNNEGKNPTKIPTKEEQEDVDKRVVEIGILTTMLSPSLEDIHQYQLRQKGMNMYERMEAKKEPPPQPKVEITPLMFILPGEEFPFPMYDINMWYFRCKEGTANCTFTFYPN